MAGFSPTVCKTTSRLSIITLCFIVLTVLMGFPAWVAMGSGLTLTFSPEMLEKEWDLYTPRGQAPAVFAADDDGVLTIEADKAVAFLYRMVPKDATPSQSLSWRWRVTQDFPATDLSQPGTDDRPIAVHVFFSDEEAGLLGRAMGGLARMFGPPIDGRAITYIWGGAYDAGTMLANPFMDDGKGMLVIRRPSGSGMEGWVEEQVDLAQDYAAAFGDAPGPVRAIAISADTDDTAARSRAQITDLTLGP